MMTTFIGNFGFLDQPSGDVVCLHLPIIHSNQMKECCQPLTGSRTEDLLGVPTRIQPPNLYLAAVFLF